MRGGADEQLRRDRRVGGDQHDPMQEPEANTANQLLIEDRDPGQHSSGHCVNAGLC